jgi:hypothetical protein
VLLQIKTENFGTEKLKACGGQIREGEAKAEQLPVRKWPKSFFQVQVVARWISWIDGAMDWWRD